MFILTYAFRCFWYIYPSFWSFPTQSFTIKTRHVNLRCTWFCTSHIPRRLNHLRPSWRALIMITFWSSQRLWLSPTIFNSCWKEKSVHLPSTFVPLRLYRRTKFWCCSFSSTMILMQYLHLLRFVLCRCFPLWSSHARRTRFVFYIASGASPIRQLFVPSSHPEVLTRNFSVFPSTNC